MKRPAAPMIGGLITSFIMKLFIYPVVYYLYESFKIRRQMRDNGDAG